MLKRIIRKELLEVYRDGRFRWAIGLLFLLLLASLVTGSRRWVQARKLQQRAQAEERARWLNKGEMDPHPAMHFGFYVYKPQLPLSAIDDGIAPYVGSYNLLEAHQQTLFQDKPAEVEAPMRRVSEITAATCLQILVPLLIVLLGFSSVAEEREQGTLLQLLSVGVSKQKIVTGKMLGKSAVLMLVLVPAAVFGSMAILLNSEGLVADTSQRLLLMSTAHIVYFSIFVAVTFTISIMARSSRQALLLSLLFWFVACLMSPPVMIGLAGRIYPSPPGFKFVADIAKEKKERFFVHYAERELQLEDELKAKYHAASVAELPVNPEGVLLLEEQQIDDDIYNRAFRRLYWTYRKQNLIYQAGAILSPMIGVQSLSMGMAGTDTEAQEHFSEAARRYRRLMETTLNEDVAYNRTSGQRGRELWEKIPPFKYAPPTARWAFKNYQVSNVGLVLWLLAAAIALRRAMRRL
jgi:ABC-2 type transport system permease protein